MKKSNKNKRIKVINEEDYEEEFDIKKLTPPEYYAIQRALAELRRLLYA